MDIFLKALIGAVLVIVIQVLTRSRYFYIAGLVLLFLTFALINHDLVGSQRITAELKTTIIFSMLSLIPYFVYLLVLCWLVERFRIALALFGTALYWVLPPGSYSSFGIDDRFVFILFTIET